MTRCSVNSSESLKIQNNSLQHTMEIYDGQTGSVQSVLNCGSVMSFHFNSIEEVHANCKSNSLNASCIGLTSRASVYSVTLYSHMCGL